MVLVVAKVPAVGAGHGKFRITQMRGRVGQGELHTTYLNPDQVDLGLHHEVNQVDQVDRLGSFTEGQGVGALVDGEVRQVEEVDELFLLVHGDLDEAGSLGYIGPVLEGRIIPQMRRMVEKLHDGEVAKHGRKVIWGADKVPGIQILGREVGLMAIKVGDQVAGRLDRG